MSEEQPEPMPDEVRRARTIRRVGYAVLGLACAYLAIPMLVSALIGLSDGDIWDPYTGERYDAAPDCYKQARDLLERSEELDELESTWNEPAREWAAKCRDEHPDLNRLINDRREELKATN